MDDNGIKVKTMEYAACHKYSFKWLVKDNITHYDTSDITFSMALRSFSKKYPKKHLHHHDKNCCYFCKSNIPVINLIVGSRNMIKLAKNMSL